MSSISTRLNPPVKVLTASSMYQDCLQCLDLVHRPMLHELHACTVIHTVGAQQQKCIRMRSQLDFLQASAALLACMRQQKNETRNQKIGLQQMHSRGMRHVDAPANSKTEPVT